MRSWVWLAAASLVAAAPASAAVTYSFSTTGNMGAVGPSFTLVLPDYITSATSFAAGDLSSCASGYMPAFHQTPGTCTSVVFTPTTGTMTFTGSNGATTAVFATNFGSNGSFTPTSLVGPFLAGGSLIISGAPAAVPEPTTWAMLVAGFGTLGAALRRKRHARLARLARG